MLVPSPADLAPVPPEVKVSGGICFVIGCHPCWKDDYLEALKHYPNANICLVNYAVELMPGDYIATIHGDNLPKYISAYRRFWPQEKDPILLQADRKPTSDIGYKIDVRTHGPSGTFAAAAMAAIGFDKAIMCGSPVTGGGGYAQKTFHLNDWQKGPNRRINAWHEGLRKFKAEFPDIAEKMRSMSGATKTIFGGLDDN